MSGEFRKINNCLTRCTRALRPATVPIVAAAAVAIIAPAGPSPAAAQDGLIAYQMVDQWPQRDQAAEGLFMTPIDLDVSVDGHVFIADAGMGGVHTLLPTGSFTVPFGVSGGLPAQLGRVGQIAVGPVAPPPGDPWPPVPAFGERVYVLDTAIERLVIYGTDGQFVEEWDDIAAEGVAASPDGRVYVLDRDTSQVRALDARTGDERFVFGGRGTEDGQFTFFSDVDVSPDGRVLVVGDRRGQRVQLFDLATDEALAGDDPPEPATLRKAYDLTAARFTSGGSTCSSRQVNAMGGDKVFVGQATSACIIDGRDVTFAIAASTNSRTICRDTVTLPRLRPLSDQYFALAVVDPNPGKCGAKRADLETTPVVVKYTDESLRAVDTVWEASSNEDADSPLLFSPELVSMPSDDVIFVRDSSSQLRFFSLDGQQVATCEWVTWEGDVTGDLDLYALLEASGSDVLGEVFAYYLELHQVGGVAGRAYEAGIGRFKTVEKRGRYGMEREIEAIWTDPLVTTGQQLEIPALTWNPVSRELLVIQVERIEQQRTENTLLVRYTPEGREAGEPIDLPDDGTTNPYVDLVVGPDGRILTLDDLADVVRVFDPDGTPVVDVPVAFDARSVAGGPPSPDGTVFALREPGGIERYADDGTVTARLDGRPLPFSDPTTLTDIVVDGQGRVYVADGQSSLISVFERSGDPDEIPIPNDAECLFKGKQTADPSQLRLGEATTVSLELAGRCGINEEPADIVFVIPYYPKLRQGVDVARPLILDMNRITARLDFSKHRVAIVSYYNTTNIELPLTNDRDAYYQAVVDVRRFDPPSAEVRPRLKDALEVADGLFEPQAGRRRVMVLLYAQYCTKEMEQYPGQCAGLPPAEDTALAIRQSGTTIVGVNSYGAIDLVSSDEDAVFDVVDAHRRMVRYAPPEMLATGLELVDTLPSNMTVDQSSITGGGTWQAPRITWRADEVDFDGASFSVSLVPGEGGTWPTSDQAFATLTDGWGTSQRVEFPIPEVEVEAPTPTVTATPPPATATPTVPAGPKTVYLPIAHLARCSPKPVPVEVALVIDISSSMNAATRDGGQTKIAAARAAAGAFVGALREIDRVAVVAFDKDVHVLTELTSDHSRARGLVDGLETGTGTRIDSGLIAATELLGSRRADADVALILLTDGRPSTGPEEVRRAAAGARAAGIAVYAIGLGDDVDGELLTDVAGDPSRYYEAPQADDLAAIYDALLSRVVNVCP